MECHAFTPQGQTCLVVLPPMTEPFRIGIRAFNLKDPSVGSFAMISNINYIGDICIESGSIRRLIVALIKLVLST